MTIGEIIRARRKEMKMSLEDVGKAVGVDRATVMRWEKGQIQKMGRDKIASLARVLQLDPVLFVQPAEILTDDEHRLLYAYRGAEPQIQDAALTMLENSAEKQTRLRKEKNMSEEQMA